MNLASNDEHIHEREAELKMLLDSFLSPSPIKILREVQKRGNPTKTELLEEKGTGVHWPTYSKYERPLIDAGLIRIEEEATFPFGQRIILTEKGKKVLDLLDELQRMIITDEERRKLGLSE